MRKIEKMKRGFILKRLARSISRGAISGSSTDKKFVLAFIFSLACYDVWAAGDVTKALNSLTTSITGIFDAATKVMYAVAAVAGIIGAIMLYQKWNSGDPNTGKLVGAWIGAAVFLGLVATFLRTMFI
jgi:uncharacterized membrane protein YeaQ/YmgE (transglycosylase-associated protein family)